MRTFQRIARWIRPAVGLPVLAALALTGLLVLSLGCEPEQRDAAAAAPAVNPRLPDIPVPAGFEFQNGESSDSTINGSRQVLHCYKGSASVRQVAEFYRRSMASFGWTLSSEKFAGGVQRLRFEKDGETCHVSIWESWGTRIQIYVLPNGSRSLEPTINNGQSP